MPTYEYRCQKCQQTFDAVQSMKDPHFTTCPEALCRNADGWAQGEVTRLLGTGAGLIFKGSGFYITDYRSQGYKDAAKKDVAPTAGSTGGGGEGGASGGSAPAKPKTGESSGSAPSSPPPASSGPSPAPKT